MSLANDITQRHLERDARDALAKLRHTLANENVTKINGTSGASVALVTWDRDAKPASDNRKSQQLLASSTNL